MKVKNRAAGKFYGAFLSTVCLAMCPVMLIYGILASDAGTRRTGFGDTEPAVWYEYDGNLRISVLGHELFIDGEYILSAKDAANSVSSFIPPQMRILAEIPAAVSGLIRHICEYVT